MDDTPASPDDDPHAAPPAAEPAASPVAAPQTPAAPWEGPSPDVVAWLLVNWHNKHPLARRLGIKDVHTVGAVALPFMAQALPKEPSLEAPAGDVAAAPEPAKPKRRWPWQRGAAPAGGPRPAWREEFIPGLKTPDVAALALDNGFTSAPDELPLRRVEIDDQALAGEANQPGAWPMELVLLSAAFDVGPARRRVLVGRRDQVLGKRALDPMRLGVVGGVAALLLVVSIWAAWPSGPSAKEKAALAAAEAASAASAASAAALAQAASEAEAAAARLAAAQAASAAEAASEAASSASAPDVSASGASAPQAAASAAGTLAPPGTIPGIRPPLQSAVERARREQAQAAAASGAGKDVNEAKDSKDGKAAESAKPGASAPVTEAEKRLAVDDAGLTSLMKRGMAPGGKPVALVGLPVKSKADAEAQLARMREMIAVTMGGGGPANADVFQTKEGWRAAVWPFATREEAQLINATLLARGMRARAVDF